MQYDWENIDTVLLDMDGTLLDLHFDTYFWRDYLPHAFAKHKNIALEDAEHKINQLINQHMGTLNWYCVDFWSDSLELDIMRIKAEVTHKIKYRPTAQAFLERCQKECNDVRMVTNAHRKVLDLKIQKTGIDRYFDQLLCSHELNHPKEDVQFWECLNNNKPFNPKRTLFLDDNEAVLESADQYGITQLYSIAEPDSRQKRVSVSRFTMLVDLI